jgi:hypothetical protein
VHDNLKKPGKIPGQRTDGFRQPVICPPTIMIRLLRILLFLSTSAIAAPVHPVDEAPVSVSARSWSIGKTVPPSG